MCAQMLQGHFSSLYLDQEHNWKNVRKEEPKCRIQKFYSSLGHYWMIRNWIFRAIINLLWFRTRFLKVKTTFSLKASGKIYWHFDEFCKNIMESFMVFSGHFRGKLRVLVKKIVRCFVSHEFSMKFYRNWTEISIRN